MSENRAAAGWPLVGRDDEVAYLVAGVGRPGGPGGHALITGEAGVGKTRLAAEVAAVLGAHGWTVHHFAAHPGGRAIPLAPFAGLFGPGDPDTPMVDRFGAAAGRLTDGGPALVVLEDCHWVDDVSAVFVRHLAALAPLRLVLTARLDQPLPEALLSLAGTPAVVHLVLFRLARSEVVSLLTQRLGGPPSEALAARLWAATAGNAFFLTELVDAGVETGAISPKAGQWVLTRPLGELMTGLDAVLKMRLSDLDAAEQEVVELLAVGGSLSVSMLEELADPRVLASLESRRLIRAHQDGRRLSVRLAHPLYEEWVLASMGPLGQRARKRRLVESVTATSRRRQWDRLVSAVWGTELGRVGEAGELVELARELIAGFPRALYATGPGTPVLDVPASQVPPYLETVVRLARSAAEAGGSFAALDVLLAALRLLGRAEEADGLLDQMDATAASPVERIRVLRLRSGQAARRGDPEAAAAFLEDAARLAEGTAQGVSVRADRVGLLLAAGGAGEAAVEARALLSTLDGAGAPEVAGAGAAGMAAHDPVVEARAHAVAVLAASSGIQGRPVEALAVLDREAERLGGRESPYWTGALMAGRVLALTLMGSLAEARDLAGAALEVAEAFARPAAVGLFAHGLAYAELALGRPATAVPMFERSVRALSGYDAFGLRRSALAGLAMAHSLLGDTGAAKAALKERDASGGGYASGPDWPGCRASAWLAAATGDRDGAIGVLRQGLEQSRLTGATMTSLTAAHDLLRFGASGSAEEVAALAADVEGPLAHAYGLHAQAVATRRAAAFEEAAEAFSACGARLLAAEAALGAAEAHAADGLKGRADRWLVRSRALAAACEGAVTPLLASSIPDADLLSQLTRREREIAVLAGQGLSDRSISEQLHTSLRTVQNHLYRVYSKLGVTSRIELAGVLHSRLTD